MKLVKDLNIGFPLDYTKKINILRMILPINVVPQLRNDYADDTVRLKIMRRLKKSNEELNEFWNSRPLDP